MREPTSLRRSRRVVGALMRASLMSGLQYRSDFLFDAITGVFRPAATVAPLFLVYGHRDAVLGWTFADATLVLGLFLLMQAVLEGIIEPNLGAVVEHVRTGTFDLVLLRPADSQLLVSLQSVAPARLWHGLAGIAVCGWAVARMPTPSVLDVVVACAMLLCGIASMYGLWLLTVCLAFIFVRVDNLRHLLSAVGDAGRWPVQVYSGWVRWSLTVLIPVALFTSFPAMALRGDWDTSTLLIAGLTTTAFVLGSRMAWITALSRYTSASS